MADLDHLPPALESDVWVVGGTGPAAPGVTGGGRQSARNLLAGLRKLRVAFAPVCQTHRDQPAVATLNTDFGPGLEIALPAPSGWADPLSVEFLQRVLGERAPRVIHLLDPIPHLGTWLAAVRELPCQLALTALDYNWLCAQSHLLTRRGAPCPGPHGAADCMRCHFDHRQFGRRLALRAGNALAFIPIRWPLPALAYIQDAHTRTNQRLASLPADFERLDTLIAPSAALADRFAANGMARRKITVVPYGTPAGTRIDWSDRPSVSQGVVFGFAGRVEFDKGPDLLLGALEAIRREDRTNVRLIVYAGASGTAYNRTFLRSLRSAGREHWIEHASFDGASPSAIDAAMRRIHFLVAPSRWTDNRPNSVLEALVRCTPVIAPDQGSFPEMIVPGRNGWLYSSVDPANSLRDLLSRIAGDPERYGQLKFDVTTTRTPEDEAADVANVYQRLLRRSNGE